MVPEGVCEKIPNLLISTTENGVQNSSSLLAAYKLFDKYLDEEAIPRPVVVVSDGHSSRFDYDVLSFLQKKQIRLFLSPPDMTGVLQLLDQINRTLHKSYKVCKEEMFNQLSTINREAFMLILTEVWGKWATKEAIIRAGTRVRVTPEGLSVEFMQQDKFEVAAKLLEEPTEERSITFSPTKEQNVRRASKEYYEIKIKNLEEELKKIKGEGLDLGSVSGLLPVTPKVKKPKLSKEKIRVTQVCASMEGKKVIEVVKELREKKEEVERKKEARLREKRDVKEAFIRCKNQCVCKKEKCDAIGYKQCPKCLDVLRSACSKKTCQNEDGTKSKMLLPAAVESECSRKKRKIARRSETSESESDIEDFDDDTVDLTKVIKKNVAEATSSKRAPRRRKVQHDDINDDEEDELSSRVIAGDKPMKYDDVSV